MVKKLPFEALAKKLEEASKLITVGDTYLHYKQQHPYRVISLAINEEDQQVYVVYRAQYDLGITFVRPASSWNEEVTWQGQTVNRFTKAE